MGSQQEVELFMKEGEMYRLKSSDMRAEVQSTKHKAERTEDSLAGGTSNGQMTIDLNERVRLFVKPPGTVPTKTCSKGCIPPNIIEDFSSSFFPSRPRKTACTGRAQSQGCRSRKKEVPFLAAASGSALLQKKNQRPFEKGQASLRDIMTVTDEHVGKATRPSAIPLRQALSTSNTMSSMDSGRKEELFRLEETGSLILQLSKVLPTRTARPAHIVEETRLDTDETSKTSDGHSTEFSDSSLDTEFPLIRICANCEAQFPSPTELLTHMKITHGNRKFICRTCGFAFKQRAHLKTHIEVRHEKIRFVCKQCHVGFTTAWTLKRHVLAVHEKKRSSSCEICGMMFTQNSDMRRHIRTVHEQIKPHRCSLCPVRFSQPWDRKRHMTAVHGIKFITDEPESP